MCTCTAYVTTKLPDLKWKTRPKQLLGSLPLAFAPPAQFGSSLTRKHWTRMERLPRDKHSSLLRTLVDYALKKCYVIRPWSLQSGLSWTSWCCQTRNVLREFGEFCRKRTESPSRKKNIFLLQYHNRTACIRHLCNKITFLSFHKCLICSHLPFMNGVSARSSKTVLSAKNIFDAMPE